MKLKNVSMVYKNKKGIHNIDLDTSQNKVIAVLGHNGCGKTTLFKTMLGLLKFQEGELSVNRGVSIGYLPECRCLYQTMTVCHHIRFMGKLRKMSKIEIEVNMNQWLASFKMEHLKYETISSLSKGNQQKVQFICAMIHNPNLMILDEPMSGLDIVNIQIFKKIITQEIEKGTKIILSSHQYDDVEEFSEYVVILKEGKIVLQGYLRNLKDDYDYEFISLSDDNKQKYKDHKDVLGIETQGHTSRYRVSKKSKLLASVLEKRRLNTVKLEAVSLKDLVSSYYE
ncbi:ABC transporter ATP-binding protein [Erysipelothrix urinaevulpis]|uniref:ABC transporter ATP-binding protein n=1 Tax=Erysipelothrix urinaevulpis TaxID=2683717 RepID=UPI00135C7B1E|nr:ATP-binding cassette domain-containing protein [Erysipelothrix urinaevulpis]